MVVDDLRYEGIEGRTIAVTGAAGGIGLAIVSALHAQGAHVIASDIARSDEIDQLVAKGNVDFHKCDLANDAQCEALLTTLANGPLHGLVNNAAIFDMAPLLESDLEMFDRLYRINVRAAFRMMQGAAAIMIDNESAGAIVNFSSQAGRRGEALVSHYCATKAAIISYTQSAALALADHNIRVNAVSPGVIDTPMWEKVDGLFAKYEGLEAGQKKRAVGAAVPMGYMGTPVDLIGPVLFLLSSQSDYITGQTLNVDGGNVLS